MPPDQHAGHDMAAMESMARDGIGNRLAARLDADVRPSRRQGRLDAHGARERLRPVSPRLRRAGPGPVREHQLVHGHGGPKGGRRARRVTGHGQHRALDDRRLRVSGSAGHRRAVQRAEDSRPAASARPGDGARGRVRRADPGFAAVAGLRRPCRRAGPRPGGLSAPSLSHAESAGANLPPLARCDTHHVRCRDSRGVRESLEGRSVGVQRA